MSLGKDMRVQYDYIGSVDCLIIRCIGREVRLKISHGFLGVYIYYIHTYIHIYKCINKISYLQFYFNAFFTIFKLHAHFLNKIAKN